MLKITFAISKQIQFFAFHIPAVGGFVLLFNMKHDIYKIFSFVNYAGLILGSTVYFYIHVITWIKSISMVLEQIKCTTIVAGIELSACAAVWMSHWIWVGKQKTTSIFETLRILAQLVFAFRYAYNRGRLVTVLVYGKMKCNNKKFNFDNLKTFLLNLLFGRFIRSNNSKTQSMWSCIRGMIENIRRERY